MSSDLSASDQQLKRFADYYNLLARREPNLPGVRSLAGLNDELFAGFNAADTRILTTALYLQAREKVETIGRPIMESDVRSSLSRPIDLSRFERPYLERTLAAAKGRAAKDVEYRRQLTQLPPGTIMCVDENGTTYSPSLCQLLLDIGVVALA